MPKIEELTPNANLALSISYYFEYFPTKPWWIVASCTIHKLLSFFIKWWSMQTIQNDPTFVSSTLIHLHFLGDNIRLCNFCSSCTSKVSFL